MRACLVLIVLLVGVGWTDEPLAWMRPDGRPIDPILFQRDSSVCREEASIYFGRAWVAVFTDCLQHLGYIPLQRDFFR
jgi:hypothetical protein